MHTEGLLAPTSAAEVRRSYAELAGAARTVTRETAKAMAFDREEFADRVTDDVRGTAHDALFASLLEVRVGEFDEFEAWRDTFEGDVRVLGSREVANVTWHVVPFGADGPPTRAATDPEVTPVAMAATFENEPAAATATLRRAVFGRVYHDVVHADPVETGAHTAVPPEDEASDEDGDDEESPRGTDTDGAGSEQ